MRIGLLGGSFNPPHLGHLHISLEAKKRLKLDQIWWLPTKQNPFKKEQNNNFDQRLLLCKNLTHKISGILIKDYENNLKSNYSIDLIKRIIRKYPKHKFFWVMGADSVINFHLWQRWKQILTFLSLIVVDRDDYFYLSTKSKGISYCRKLNNQKCFFLKIKKVNISSTKIRKNNV